MSDSPARTKSWWGVFISLLATIALVLSGLTSPFAQAQNVGAQLQYNPDRGEGGAHVDLDIPGFTGDPNQATTLNWFTGTVNGQNVGYWVYCVEGRRGPTPSDGSWIWRGTVSDWDSYGSRSEPTNLLVGSSDDAQSRREKINWIVHNSYPHKSAAEMGFSGVSRDDLIAATSAAIWAQSDDADISGLDRGAQDVFDHLTENVQRLPLKSGEIGGLIVESSGQDVVVVPERDAPKPKLVASLSVV